MTAIDSTVCQDVPASVTSGAPCTITIDQLVIASAEIALTIPESVTTVGGRARPVRAFKIDAAFLVYVADATVGSREITIEIEDAAGEVLYETNLNATIGVAVASATLRLNLGLRAVAGQDGGNPHEWLPLLTLAPGSTIKIRDRNQAAIGQATDQLGLKLHGLVF